MAEFNTIVAEMGKRKKKLATMRASLEITNNKFRRFQLQITSHVKAFARLATIVKDQQNARYLSFQCENLALKTQCTFGLAVKAEILHALVADIEQLWNTKSPRVRATCKSAVMKVVPEQTCSMLPEHNARLPQLKGNVNELKSKLKVLKSCINVTDSYYSLLDNS